jgi:hypothetical protein
MKKKLFFHGRLFFINLLRWTISREFHQHSAGCSDDLSCKEDIFHAESFDLPPIFRFVCKVHFEQQKQIVGRHHQLKNGFVGSKGSEQKASNGQIISGLLDVIFSIIAFFASNDHFF